MDTDLTSLSIDTPLTRWIQYARMFVHWRWNFPQYVRNIATIFLSLAIVLLITITLHSQNSAYLSASERFGLNSQAPRTPKHAFATILTAEGDIEFPDVEEPYLRAARLLTFQLLNNPRTRNSSYQIPFLVLVTPDVPQRHRVILSRDGATVIPVESLERDWIHPKWGRWSDVLAKLNLWKLEEYDKIAFLDADSVLFRPIHDIFDSPATLIRETLPSRANETGKLPNNYMIAGIHDRWMEQFMQPPPGQEFYEKDNYLNTGFFVLHPSRDLFDYYMTLLDTPGQFDSAYPEQNLLNCAHRTDGSMPWQDLGPGWNSKGASQSDYENGLKSLHHKWWRPIPDQFIGELIAEAMEVMEWQLRMLDTST